MYRPYFGEITIRIGRFPNHPGDIFFMTMRCPGVATGMMECWDYLGHVDAYFAEAMFDSFYLAIEIEREKGNPQYYSNIPDVAS